MSTEYRLVSFRQPVSAIVPPQIGAVTALTVDFAGSIPEVAQQMDGWTVVNTQLFHAGEDVVIMFTLKLDAVAPDDLGDIHP